MPAESPAPVQIFGYRDSRPTQHAIRYFRERRINVSFVDLSQRPIAPTELQRFFQKFGGPQLLDAEGRAYRDAGLAHMRLAENEIFERLIVNSRLIRVPLVRRGHDLAVGADEAGWKRLAELT